MMSETTLIKKKSFKMKDMKTQSVCVCLHEHLNN